MILWFLAGCGWFSSAPEVAPAPVADLSCPPGMVYISGGGEIGMRGQPYGVVVTKHMAVVEAPERGCEDAVASTRGATACWVQTDQVDPVLKPRPVSLEGFCIERFPFPGEGAAYTEDGMTAWDAAALDELLSSGRFGPRRLCTFTEFQAAVAGLKQNTRFVYGDEFDGERCGEETIGQDARCRNPETGLHEYGAIHSHWTRADAAFVGAACDAPPCRAAGSRPLREGMLIVAGGTGRSQTRQAPFTPHTWHDHGDPAPGPCDDQGWDDQPVICADPGAGESAETTRRTEEAWVAFVTEARTTGLMSTALGSALGRSLCET